ncbi:MAG: Glutamine--fructose-6-phosphate aminotransferase [isomerizing] [Chlamydiales bacterium]|nr:Glutamine--fructose-6-phosphate aminotransferase [isomerizing] [Chlamydiales bacterium]MCH9620544.1 Glutamine--fructose-6-phosphate aminotransferase [isomerizing] [Chlamydiales bacterium]MCH9623008.1 Glutamine--fructose-6-phosphate aminotransferase [isomerizing] [Chlamydiales bacterium]
MCGIAGYIGERKAVPIVLEGIHKLEYRGYDSAGIAAFIDGKLEIEKKVGKVSNLDHTFEGKTSHLAIAQTRWATHGTPNEANAHPHFDHAQTCAVVHNGIIENHEKLRKQLEKKGIQFHSETDTEVIPQLISSLYQGDFLAAVQQAVSHLEGAFALAVLHKDHPEEMVCVAKESPLAIGVGEGEMFIGSDAQAFLKHTRQVVYLHSGEVAHLTAKEVKVFDTNRALLTKEITEVGNEIEDPTKGNFTHYTLKEIYEQPHTLKTAIMGEIDLKLETVSRIVILACGTSYHAGLIASYTFEELARIPVEVHVSSEYRYRTPIVSKGTLAIAISQSGETADTLAAINELKKKGAKVLGICNVLNSTLTRLADDCLFLRAGPEIGVCSTKAFTSQLAILFLLASKLGSQTTFQKELKVLPEKAKQVLQKHDQIKEIAAKYAQFDNFFYLGRRYMYPTALEGALKLKEIGYINANGYAAGEMKHGPIALIEPNCPTVACMGDQLTYDKMISNLREVKARAGKIIAIVPEKWDASLADDVITIPQTCDELAPILTTIATQLLAYEIASLRGCEIDQPRNLAKSVTVE